MEIDQYIIWLTGRWMEDIHLLERGNILKPYFGYCVQGFQLK